MPSRLKLVRPGETRLLGVNPRFFHLFAKSMETFFCIFSFDLVAKSMETVYVYFVILKKPVSFGRKINGNFIFFIFKKSPLILRPNFHRFSKNSFSATRRFEICRLQWFLERFFDTFIVLLNSHQIFKTTALLPLDSRFRSIN